MFDHLQTAGVVERKSKTNIGGIMENIKNILDIITIVLMAGALMIGSTTLMVIATFVTLIRLIISKDFRSRF